MNIEPIVWQAPPKELFLRPKEVQIWHIQGCQKNYLSPEEQSRADRLISPLDRERFMLAHNGQREILGKYLNQDPKNIIFEKNSSGKPYLKNNKNIHFNLSHAENMILCAVALNPVGIDVEYLNKNIDYLNIAKRFFSHSEYELIKNIQHKSEQKKLFFQLWTAKEAYFKTSGVGISAGLEKEIPKDFVLLHFTPAPHYIAAVGGEEKMVSYIIPYPS